MFNIIACPISLCLWTSMFCFNAKLVLEQQDLVDRDFPPGGRPNQVGNNVVVDAAAQPPEPPKPKPEAVVKNAALVELQEKIDMAQKIEMELPEQQSHVAFDSIDPSSTMKAE